MCILGGSVFESLIHSSCFDGPQIGILPLENGQWLHGPEDSIFRGG